MAIPYAQKLKDPRWQRKRLEALSDKEPLARMVAEYPGGLPQEDDHYRPLHKALGGEPRP